VEKRLEPVPKLPPLPTDNNTTQGDVNYDN
jgi:Ring finger domain